MKGGAKKQNCLNKQTHDAHGAATKRRHQTTHEEYKVSSPQFFYVK